MQFKVKKFSDTCTAFRVFQKIFKLKSANKNFEKNKLDINNIYKIQFEYIKESIRYMFLANGGAITAFLIKFDTHKFQKPLILFSFGVAYTIIIPIIMHLKSSIDYISCMENTEIEKKIIKILLKPISMILFTILIYMPVILFITGIIETVGIFNQSISQPSTKTTDKILEILVNMVSN